MTCTPRYKSYLGMGAESRKEKGQNLLLFQHRYVWERAIKMTGADFFHSHTPLWHNPLLGELLSLPGATRWAAKGIVFLFQIITLFGVRNFQTL